jgi:hypothetical protein
VFPQQHLQTQPSTNSPNFLSFPREGHIDSNFYGPSTDADLFSGFDWIFNASFDDALPYEARADGIMSVQPSQSAGTSKQVSRQAVVGGQPSSELDPRRPIDGTIALTPTDEHQPEDRGAPEDRWPMEWHAVPVKLLSLPRLGGGDEHLPPQSSHFNIPATTPLTKAHLLNTVQLPMQGSPWQTVSLAEFPTEQMLDHCIDLYFVHFDKVDLPNYRI